MIIAMTIATAALSGPFGVPSMGSPDAGVPGHATARAVTDVGWVGPGQTFHIIVPLTIDEGWHVYWVNPGASGLPTEVEVDVPPGYTTGAPIYPRPELFHGEEGITYGYADEVAIFVPVTAPDVTADGREDFRVRVTWLACRKRCVQGSADLSLETSVRAWDEGPPRRDKRLADWQSRLPKELDELNGASARVMGSMLVLQGPATASPASFLPIEQLGVRFAEADLPSTKDGRFELRIPIIIEPSNFQGNDPVVRGLLTLGTKETDPCYRISLPYEAPGMLQGSIRGDRQE